MKTLPETLLSKGCTYRRGSLEHCPIFYTGQETKKSMKVYCSARQKRLWCHTIKWPSVNEVFIAMIDAASLSVHDTFCLSEVRGIDHAASWMTKWDCCPSALLVSKKNKIPELDADEIKVYTKACTCSPIINNTIVAEWTIKIIRVSMNNIEDQNRSYLLSEPHVLGRARVTKTGVGMIVRPVGCLRIVWTEEGKS